MNLNSKSPYEYTSENSDTKSVIIVAVAVISIIAVCIHGLVDTVFFRPQIQFIFWTMVAVARMYQFVK